MSKPVFDIEITTPEQKSGKVTAVFDSGAFPTIIRQDKLPPTQIIKYHNPEIYGGAVQGSKLNVIGCTRLIVEYNNKMISTLVEVAPLLAADMLIGARTMQEWDISIVNKNGKTEINIGHDMRDPELNIICQVSQGCL
ncbi:MAG: hypothetical protein HY958_06245 [Bacteroidia bacterium]|nr:hypothetical protein [Bacteroidia bacterium]